MNSFKHSANLLSLPLLLSGFEVMLLRKAFVLRLNEEHMDSTRLLSSKGLYVVSKPQQSLSLAPLPPARPLRDFLAILEVAS
jgi:hypothetical protein